MGVCVLYRPVQMFPPSVSLRRVSFCADTRMFDEQIHFSRHSVSILSLLCVCVWGGLILCSLAKFMVFGDVCHKSEEIESGVLAGLRDLVENKSTELRWMHDYISLLVFTVL